MSVKLIKYGDINKGIDNGVAESVLEACIRVQTEARNLAPVAPVHGGRLKGSISFKTDKHSDGDLDVNPAKGEGYVGSMLDYAVYQEFGTRYMKPQPFLRPAIARVVYGTSTKEVIRKIMKEELKGALDGGERVKFF